MRQLWHVEGVTTVSTGSSEDMVVFFTAVSDLQKVILEAQPESSSSLRCARFNWSNEPGGWMSWFRQLDKHRGSRPRCVLMVEGSREDVASRLTRLVNLPDVVASPDDRWMPYGKPFKREDGKWDKQPANEAQLGNPKKPNNLVRPEVHRKLTDWWLAVQQGRMTTPNWDITSTCTVQGEPGLLLVEAKAHADELNVKGKGLDRTASLNSQENHRQIGWAIVEASEGLASATGKPWGLSRDHHYQLSNRFAWSWKLASLGIPVVLLYLGFLNAQDMADDGPLFRSGAEWTRVMKDHSRGALDESCWGEWLDIAGTPLIPLIRGIDQPFDCDTEEAGI